MTEQEAETVESLTVKNAMLVQMLEKKAKEYLALQAERDHMRSQLLDINAYLSRIEGDPPPAVLHFWEDPTEG